MMNSSISMEGTPPTTSAILSGQKSEYTQAFGNSLPLGKRVVSNELRWKRNDSTILPPFPEEEKERPNKSQQSWPWKERAHHSDIFQPMHEHGSTILKSAKWPWQDRANESHVFEENNKIKNVKDSNTEEIEDLSEEAAKCKMGQKLQWPWQTRAMTSDIFQDSAVPKQRRPKEYSWHQAKSTHDHKTDCQAKLDGVTQYMKDFSSADSMQHKYFGPRHGYKYILKRRENENTPESNGGGETDLVSQITKLNLDDAAVYLKEAQKNLKDSPDEFN